MAYLLHTEDQEGIAGGHEAKVMGNVAIDYDALEASV